MLVYDLGVIYASRSFFDEERIEWNERWCSSNLMVFNAD